MSTFPPGVDTVKTFASTHKSDRLMTPRINMNLFTGYLIFIPFYSLLLAIDKPIGRKAVASYSTPYFRTFRYYFSKVYHRNSCQRIEDTLSKRNGLERFTIEVSRYSTKKTSRLRRRKKPLRTLV